MAWPFSNVAAPNLDTGPGVAVPTVSTVVTAAQAWVLGTHFKNTSGVTVTVTVENTALANLVELEIPAGGEQPYEWPFRPALGVKWFASGAGVVGHLWGYV